MKKFAAVLAVAVVATLTGTASAQIDLGDLTGDLSTIVDNGIPGIGLSLIWLVLILRFVFGFNLGGGDN